MNFSYYTSATDHETMQKNKNLGNTLVHGLPPGSPPAALEGGRRPTGRAAGGSLTRPRKLLCFSTKTFVYLKKLIKALGGLSKPTTVRKTPSNQKKKYIQPVCIYQVHPAIHNHYGIQYCTSRERWDEILEPEQVWGDLLPNEQDRLNRLLRGKTDY